MEAPMLDDKKLYKDFVEGNINAFESLVLSHKDNLIYFISRYTKDLYIAEDIAQDVFAYIYIRFGKPTSFNSLDRHIGL